MGDDRHAGPTDPLPQHYWPYLTPSRTDSPLDRKIFTQGKKYPELPSREANQTHQVDMVGPCYLTGPIKFYSLHTVDTATNPHACDFGHNEA